MPTHPSVRRLAGPTAALVALVALIGIVHAPPAPAQAADPVVTVTATQGSIFTAMDCRGQTRTDVTEPIIITLTRSGDTSTPLVVNLSYAGVLASSSGLASTFPIAPGESQAVFDAGAEAPGDLIVTIEPGNGYTVGSPGGAITTMSPGIADLGCNLGNVSTTQTVQLGTAPATVDVEDVAYNPPAGLARSIEGTVPPGTTFHLDGTWSGVTTELGTFRFSEFFCESDGWCPYRADIEVIVVDAGPIPPTQLPAPPAAPAEAVPGAPTLTG
jgi:hypothetical protein